MHWIKVKSPRYEQSRRFVGMIGEVVGHWGPENSANAREGYMVEFPNGEIVGLTDEEIEIVEEPPETAG
ncbi:MAG TPA: hypothetical protein VFO52_00335 [Longimicrobiales bacterium]|nr:hypothetical protein [Longimicrobiales bacterium]